MREADPLNHCFGGGGTAAGERVQAMEVGHKDPHPLSDQTIELDNQPFCLGGPALHRLPPPPEPTLANGRRLDLRGIAFYLAGIAGSVLSLLVTSACAGPLFARRPRRVAADL